MDGKTGSTAHQSQLPTIQTLFWIDFGIGIVLIARRGSICLPSVKLELHLEPPRD